MAPPSRKRWLIIDLEATTDPTRDTKVYCKRRSLACHYLGQTVRACFEFMLHDCEADDEVLAPDHVAALLRLYGTDDRAVLRSKVVLPSMPAWPIAGAPAASFSPATRAHLMPFAAQGMNSGVRDSHNLAWKIAAVVSGQLGERLLDIMKPSGAITPPR